MQENVLVLPTQNQNIKIPGGAGDWITHENVSGNLNDSLKCIGKFLYETSKFGN